MRLLALLLTMLLGCGLSLSSDTHGVCGTDAAIDAAFVAPDAAVDAPAVCHSIAIEGQSNATGAGRTSELTGADVAYATPYGSVLEAVRLANGGTNPPVWTEYALSPTQPRVFQSIDKFGIELTLARDLVAARPGVTWRIIKADIGGTTLYDHWNPANPSPSIFTNVHDYLAAQSADCPIAAYIWIQGESDANQISRATAYGSRLTAYVNAVRARFPAVPFIYGQLNSATSAPYTATVRAGQAALSLPDVHMIDQDSYPLRADLFHYTTPAVLSLGHVYATAVLAAVP